ncbi:MAG: cytochrome c biogenesis protein CcsA [Bacteroidota bacterium]|jgi:ABC-type transport system involved in cytochrome c biogenesis permease subunit
MNIVALVDVLVVVMPVLYTVLMGIYAASFFGNVPSIERFKTPLLILTVACHVLYIGVRTVAFDHLPITTVFEIMTMLALSISIAYAYIEMRTKVSNTGFFILVLAFLFQTVSSLFIRDLVEIREILRNRLLGFHVSTVLLGIVGVSLSAVYALLYLMLYHEIKSSRFGTIYSRLPNLETLEQMNIKAVFFAFTMLSVAIAIGFIWLPRAIETFSYFDPKIIVTLVIWGLYGISLAARRLLGWQGRKMMIVSLIAFGFVFLSMTVINLYMSGFHSFY